MTSSKWRERYKVHPAADVFPMMSDEELEKLGNDIKANGLKTKIGFTYDDELMDGRNRLEAMERAGLPDPLRSPNGGFNYTDVQIYNGDPIPAIISLNIRRRHLTKEQQADLIVAAFMAAPKPVQAEPVSEDAVLDLTEELAADARAALNEGQASLMDKLTEELKRQNKGGRGKKDQLKEKVITAAKEQGISESTAKRSLAKAKGKTPKPKPPSKRNAADNAVAQSGITTAAARKQYLAVLRALPVDPLKAELKLFVAQSKKLVEKAS